MQHEAQYCQHDDSMTVCQHEDSIALHAALIPASILQAPNKRTMMKKACCSQQPAAASYEVL